LLTQVLDQRAPHDWTKLMLDVDLGASSALHVPVKARVLTRRRRVAIVSR
jgi:hypothetical protein